MAGVSVIIPAFNAAATLNATLQSVVQQSYGDWEVIIVDDGSSDFTASNAAVWCSGDSRFRLVKQANLGPGAARNNGARNAIAPWLFFLDADDLIDSDHLKQLVATTVADPAADVIYGGFAKITPDGRIGARWVTAPGKGLFERLSTGNQFSMHECLVRADVFRRAGGFDTALLTCEDWDLWQRLARSGARFSEAPGGLAYYRMRPGSLSRRVERLFDDGCQVITRCHHSDPRVAAPLTAYENGMPKDQLGHALLCFALWCAGLLIGDEKDPSALLQRAQWPETDGIDFDRAVSAIRGSVPTGACSLDHDWPVLWPKFRHDIHQALSLIEQRCAIPLFAERCLQALEANLRTSFPELRSLAEPSGAVRQPDAAVPPVGDIAFGDFWRLAPISRHWGYDRGDPVDRMYIETFLQRHEADVRGRVLEVGDNAYTKRFGGDRVTQSDVLHVSPESKEATIIGDLAAADHIADGSFDCIILTQTLHLIFDMRAAVTTLERILKPGGTLLLTVPGISQVDSGEWGKDWHWSVTANGLRRLLTERFPAAAVTVESRGNVLAACAFLQGLSQQDIGDFAFQADDPHYPVTVLARVTKPPAAAAETAPAQAPASKDGSRQKPPAGEAPIILMYHRVETPKHDPWLLRVSPENLAQQLQVLSAQRDVVPLPWLLAKLKDGNLPRGIACVTFDDGYADVLHNGKPLLDKFGCPATVFLATHYVGNDEGFWWDILVRIMFDTANLPPRLALTVRGTEHAWRLNTDGAGEAAISRADLHLSLWKLLKPLRADERAAALEKLAAWAGTDAGARPGDRTISLDEAALLINPGFIDVGAHSVTHASLPLLSNKEITHEVSTSRQMCQELTGRPVNIFAYPFGDVDDRTAAIVRACGFELACTTIGGSVTLQQDRMQVPRVSAGNWGAEEFESKISQG